MKSRWLHSFFAFWLKVQYAFPTKLLVLQLRTHQLILLTWLFLFLVITGGVLDALGAQYLFLEPEYLNQTGFTAMFLLGLSFGVFSLAYQMTCYILDGNYFFFLGLERRPFMTFSINNSVVPLLFWLTYCAVYISFHSQNPELHMGSILLDLSGALLGGIFITTLSVIYFSLRNKDIVKLFGERIIQELRNPKVLMVEARRNLGTTIRVDWFFRSFVRMRRVQKNVVGDMRYILKVLRQNQANALIVQAFLFLMLVLLGLFQDNARFRIPAAASFMLLFSFILMAIGALSFWLRRLAPLTVVVVLGGAYLMNQLQPFVGNNFAFGLNYRKPGAAYTAAALSDIQSPDNVREDSLHTVGILNNWLSKNATPANPKPPLVFVCVSGGGNRSALWTLHTLRTLYRETQGVLEPQVAMITGASGGMIGAAYWRELLRQQQLGNAVNLLDTLHLQNVSSDLLNSPVLNLTINLLLPNWAWELDGHRYEKDRGYAWELQLQENIPLLKGLRLHDYAEPESTAKVPMMVLSPTIGNDGRHLYISPHPKSYLMRPQRLEALYSNEFTGVDFQRLFAQHGAPNLRYTTAIRMNATFPTILPYVELPTTPPISVLDAGVLDNFGTSLVMRFLYVFRHWVQAHTSGVIIIQIRDTQRDEPTPPNRDKTVLNKIGSLFGGPIKGYSKAKDYLNREGLARSETWLGVPLDMVELQYIPRNTFKGAALSFHLTEREKQDILNSIENPSNQAAISKLKKLLRIDSGLGN